MMKVPRYALYFAPEDGCALETFGRNWFEKLRLPNHWIQEPTRYGFHATLKAPFELAPDRSEAQLLSFAEQFAAQRQPFQTPPLTLKTLAGFLALRATGGIAEISNLADACVTEFERFRASISSHDIARRLNNGLTNRERDHLMRWGYPFVFDTYRFHMTLTGKLNADDLDEAHRRATEVGKPVFSEPVSFSSVCLFRQTDRNHPFHLLARFPFGCADA